MMGKEKQEHFVTTGMIEEKNAAEEKSVKNVGCSNKVAKSRTNDRSTESDMKYKCVEGQERLR